jgi:hypothetical protein
MSWDCFGGFLDRIMTGKKVQSSGHRLQCPIVLAGSSLNFFGGFLDQITNYDRKNKKVVDPYKARKRYTLIESLDLIVSVK